jgi:hypothetical protein
MLAVIAATSELATPDDADEFLDALPIPELASMWRALQRLGRCDQVSGVWAVLMYFNRLSHRWPDRARDLAREVLRAETGEPTAMQPNDKLMLALLYAHDAEVVDRINPKLNMTSFCLSGSAGFILDRTPNQELDKSTR